MTWLANLLNRFFGVHRGVPHDILEVKPLHDVVFDEDTHNIGYKYHIMTIPDQVADLNNKINMLQMDIEHAKEQGDDPLTTSLVNDVAKLYIERTLLIG